MYLQRSCFLHFFGENYWQNAIVGPTLADWDFSNLLRLGTYFLVKSTLLTFLLVPGMFGLWTLNRCSFLTAYQRTVLKTAFWICLLGGCWMSLRAGGTLNYFFELWLILALLSLCLLLCISVNPNPKGVAVNSQGCQPLETIPPLLPEPQRGD